MDQKITFNGKTYLIPASESDNIEAYLKKKGVDTSQIKRIIEIPSTNDNDDRSLLLENLKKKD